MLRVHIQCACSTQLISGSEEETQTLGLWVWANRNFIWRQKPSLKVSHWTPTALHHRWFTEWCYTAAIHTQSTHAETLEHAHISAGIQDITQELLFIEIKLLSNRAEAYQRSTDIYSSSSRRLLPGLRFFLWCKLGVLWLRLCFFDAPPPWASLCRFWLDEAVRQMRNAFRAMMMIIIFFILTSQGSNNIHNTVKQAVFTFKNTRLGTVELLD